MCLEEKYYQHTRGELIPYVPASLKKMLDVGCGEGGFSETVKSISGAEVWGIEMTSDAAGIAATKLNKVILGSYENQFESLPKEYFDCVFFNDVLEHMADPYSVLEKTKTLLTKDGKIFCSIPNVRFIRNLYEILIKKDWEYKDQGILDRTHLRFFTQKSIQRMFNELNFEIITIEGVNPTRSIAFNILNFALLKYIEDTRYMQFVCIVKPK